jgi:glutaredoxin
MNVKIYSKIAGQCPYCEKAKKFFTSKGITYQEVIVGIDIAEDAFRALTGMTTKPAIYINGNLIGGYTDLIDYAVEHQDMFE